MKFTPDVAGVAPGVQLVGGYLVAAGLFLVGAESKVVDVIIAVLLFFFEDIGRIFPELLLFVGQLYLFSHFHLCLVVRFHRIVGNGEHFIVALCFRFQFVGVDRVERVGIVGLPEYPLVGGDAAGNQEHVQYDQVEVEEPEDADNGESDPDPHHLPQIHRLFLMGSQPMPLRSEDGSGCDEDRHFYFDAVEHSYEGLVVLVADAVVDPHAVMVEVLHAAVALAAVLAAHLHETKALFAIQVLVVQLFLHLGDARLLVGAFGRLREHHELIRGVRVRDVDAGDNFSEQGDRVDDDESETGGEVGEMGLDEREKDRDFEDGSSIADHLLDAGSAGESVDF